STHPRFPHHHNRPNLIDTRDTDTAITLRIFRNHDGRTGKGQQIGRKLELNVVRQGGPNARVVEATVSDRFAIREPPAPKYEADPSLGLNQVVTKQSPSQGWSVEVVRRILVGEREVSREAWTVVYRPQQAIYAVHPCK